MKAASGDSVAKRLDDLAPRRRELMEQMLRKQALRAAETTIPPRAPSVTAPLSFAQQRMWLLEQLAHGTSANNMETLVRVRAAFNVPALQQAVNEIVRRHESLRTTFREHNGEPVQVIAPQLSVTVPVLDLRNLPAAQRFERGVEIATADARVPFDLEAGPLVRSKLYRLGDEEYLLLLTMHHIVSDFVSMTVFFDELIAAYQSLASGLSPRLDPVPLQYADFAAWQRQSLAADQFEPHLAYWRTQLAGAKPLELLTDMPRSASGSSAGATLSQRLPDDVVDGIRALSASAGTTTFTTFLSAFAVLLHRQTHQTDIAVGVPSAGRARPELQRVIGFFVNTLVMRADLSGDPDFAECMKRVERTVLGALAHQDVPFEKLVEDLQPERRLNQHPLFQVSFQLLPVPRSLDVADRVWLDRPTASLDLAIELIDSPDGITIRADYAANLFRASTIGGLIAQYVTLLRSIVAAPGRHISELELMDESERNALIHEWSGDHQARSGPDAAAHQLIADQARRAPEAIAIEADGASYSYGQLEDAAQRIAGQLRAGGVQARDLVAVALPASFELYASLLGVWKAGAAVLPIDIHHLESRTEAAIADAQPAAILTNQRAAASLASHGRVIIADPRFDPVNGADVDTSPDDAAYVIFTSGSTGPPKGVVVEHRSLANQLRWMQQAFPLTADDCILQKYPIAFDAAIVEIFSTLAAGARLVAVDREVLADGERLAVAMRDHHVTVFDAVPSLLSAMVADGIPLTGLRRVIAGGEALPPDLLASLRESGVAEIVNMYGPTEATITATAWVDDGRSEMARVPIGRPIRGMKAYVLDPRMQPVPVGVPGELYLGGVGVARQYLHSPDATAAAFVPNPFGDPAAPRLYRTGDVVRFLPDRNLEYLGRVDRQMKVRGHRVAPEEIEQALRAHPGISDCAVVQETRGEESALKACVVPGTSAPELWPSVGEYGVYDDLLYHAMTSDAARNRAYQSAIARWAPGKTVLDIGTGADLLWARACIDAGARHIFAVEILPHAAAQASATVSALGLTDRITVIQSDSRDLKLPEPVDVIVSELIGTIASSEGAAPILNDARRLLAAGGVMIPQRASTRIACVELPRPLAQYPTFTEVSGHYVDRIFEKLGGPADVRVCVKGISREHLLSDAAVFEDLDFTGPVTLDAETPFALTLQRDGYFDGFVLWVQVSPGGDYRIDTMDGGYSWLPVLVPLGDPRRIVHAGDQVRGTAIVAYRAGQEYPDYRISATLSSAGGEVAAFDVLLPYVPQQFRHQPFYRELFDADGRVRKDGLASAPALRAWLSPRLPPHMIPDSFTLMTTLPRAASGKLDAAAMAAAPQSRPFYVAPRSDLERMTAEAWQRVLNLDRVGVHDNFFDVGGHSLLLLRLLRELRVSIAPDISLSDLFQFPTISSLADTLNRRRAAAVVSG